MPTNQTKRTGRGTKDSPLTTVQIQDLASNGVQVGDTVAGKGVLNAGGYFDAPTKTRQSGIITADSASKAVNSARDTLNNISSPTGPAVDTSGSNGSGNGLSTLYSQLSNLRSQLESSKAKEKIAQDNLTNVDLQNKLGAIGSSQEKQNTKSQDATNAVNNINKVANGDKNVNTSNVTDAFMRAANDATINNLNLTQAQITRSTDFAKTMSEYSQADIKDINATAVRAIERQSKENDRIQRAMEAVGIMGGRAQSAPRVEKSLVHQIIQDGLDRINVIDDKKNSAIRQARKAEAEFNYKLFNDSVKLAKDYNQQIEDSVSALKTEVRQSEKDYQDKLVFNQAQEERSALILANELTDATPEKIANTASANKIDPSLLMKAVSDAKFEQASRTFDTSNNALILEQKQANINKTNNDIKLANAKANSTPEKSRISNEVRRNIMDSSQFSKAEAENVFKDIDVLGLDGSVDAWLKGGYSKEQVKGIVAGYEKNVLGKDEEQTANQIRLNKVIDNFAPNQQNIPNNPQVTNTKPKEKQTPKTDRSKLNLKDKTNSNSTNNKFKVNLDNLGQSSFFKEKPKKKPKQNRLLTN